MPILTKSPPETPHTTEPALRRVLLWLATIFAIGCVLWGALLLVELASRTTETIRTSYPGVETIRLDTGASDVSILQGARGTAVRVEARVTRSFRSPTRNDRAVNGVLTLAADCDVWFACGVDYDVVVPPGTKVSADVGSGDVRITGLQAGGPLVVSGGSGNLDLLDVSAPSVDLELGSGDISGAGLRIPSVAVEVGSGDLDLALDAAPERLLTRTGSGDADLTVPAAPSYRIDTDSGSGDLSVDEALVDDDRSPRHLSISTGSGDLTLRSGPRAPAR